MRIFQNKPDHRSHIGIRFCGILLILMICPVLTGSDFLDVGIKGSNDGPLVDLSQIIKIGGSFMPNENIYEEISEEEVQDDTVLNEASAGEKPGTQSTAEVKKNPVEIVIYGRDIYMDTVKMPGEKSVRSKLEYCKKNDIPVIIDDSYAELYTRKNLYAMIEEEDVKTTSHKKD